MKKSGIISWNLDSTPGTQRSSFPEGFITEEEWREGWVVNGEVLHRLVKLKEKLQGNQLFKTVGRPSREKDFYTIPAAPRTVNFVYLPLRPGMVDRHGRQAWLTPQLHGTQSLQMHCKRLLDSSYEYMSVLFMHYFLSFPCSFLIFNSP